MTVLVWCSWVCASGGMERVAAGDPRRAWIAARTYFSPTV
jgi:hypothetical protein